MSDIEREEFEQAVTDRWSDSYSFTRFGDEDYFDEIVEGMWRGWQASRQPASVPEWIKCSDKMPKINSPVVVARISDNDGKPCLDSGVAALQPNNGWIGLGVFYRPKIDAGTIYQNDLSVMDVTHWMPLPKPPKQETTMFEMREIKCKECRSIIGYSDADYAPLILCKACANKENNQ